MIRRGGRRRAARRRPRLAAQFVVQLPADCPPDEALRRVLDLRAHNRLVPLTTVSPAVAADELVVGSRFVGRTGVGPIRFDDLMRIEQLSFAPEARAVIVKEGRVLRGRVRVMATASARGSLVSWEQDVVLPWLPCALHPLAARMLAVGYRQVLTGLLEG